MIRPLVFAALGATAVFAQTWPEWRGPDGQGISAATGLPLTWSETEGVVWKTPLSGRGHSTPVLAEGRLWLTAAREQAATAEETERRLKANTGDQPVTVLSSVSLRALCVDAASGRLLHDVELLNVREPQWVHQLNSYASPSPILAGGRLYAHFGSFGTACLDTATGQVLWRNQELQIMHENGPGSTPVLWQDRLIVHFDGSDRQFIAAYDAAGGRVLWQTLRSGEMRPNPQQRKAYGTPLVAVLNGRPTVVSPAADWVYGYDPADGRELWKLPYGELGFSMSVRPVADDQRIYFSTSFGKSQMIALKHAGLPVPEVAWRNNKNAPKMSSPVLVNGLLYYVDDGGIASCVDAATGEAVYRERLGGKFSASPIAAEGRVYFASREGVVSVLPATREFRVLARNSLDGGAIMASPVAVDGALFLRTEQALYRLGKPAGGR